VAEENQTGALLLQAVQKQVKQIQTSSLDLSFNELLDMYSNEELIIVPDYQRAFRWSPGKESRFIESLILGMPIPPVFVIELEDGKYELIDGLQRLSSYFHFRGALCFRVAGPHYQKRRGTRSLRLRHRFRTERPNSQQPALGYADSPETALYSGRSNSKR
jgi:hypothetical protein